MKNNGKMSLSRMGKMINNMPHGLALKSELNKKIKDTRKLLKDSKHKHANQEYYKPRIDANFMILRHVLQERINGVKND